MNFKTCLIIPNFNQVTYLINLINWWNMYSDNSHVYVIDNNSTYKPLLHFYAKNPFTNVKIIRCKINNCGDNLNEFIKGKIHKEYKYYCISNPDIQPHPSTPENFLDIYKHVLDHNKFHHVGFGLIINDLPDFIDNKDLILKRQTHFWDNKTKCFIKFNGKSYKGYKQPIDLTFAMYTTKFGGWEFPFENRKNWSKALRLFSAYHLEWYIDANTRIAEHDYYYKTAMQREQPGPKIKGVNSYRPKKYIKHYKKNKDEK